MGSTGLCFFFFYLRVSYNFSMNEGKLETSKTVRHKEKQRMRTSRNQRELHPLGKQKSRTVKGSVVILLEVFMKALCREA